MIAVLPREYQTRIISNVVRAIKEGKKSVLIQSPTGSGKTLMALWLAQKLYDLYGYDVGWCAVRQHLLLQACHENLERVGFEHIRYFSIFEKHPPKVGILYLDEAHHSCCQSAIEITSRIGPKIEIGLTATPFRTDRAKLLYATTITDAGIRALIDQGYLAPFHQYTFNMPWTPENIANIYLQSRERWGMTVGYFRTKLECDECARLIREGGVPCEVVWAGSDQEAQIAAFISGDVPILLNMVILTEGFNANELKTVFVRPGSEGPTIQMAGRVLRPKPFAQIVQNEATLHPFTNTASCERKFALNGGKWEERDAPSNKAANASFRAAGSMLQASMINRALGE